MVLNVNFLCALISRGEKNSATTAKNKVVAIAAGKRERRQAILLFFCKERAGFLCAVVSPTSRLKALIQYARLKKKPQMDVRVALFFSSFSPILFNITHVNFDRKFAHFVPRKRKI